MLTLFSDFCSARHRRERFGARHRTLWSQDRQLAQSIRRGGVFSSARLWRLAL